MSNTPPNRNPKRQRQKEGAQQRRAAELAALQRQQRNRRIIRFAIFAVIAFVIIAAISFFGGDDDDSSTASSTKSTTTTSVADSSSTTAAATDTNVTPLKCAGPDGTNTDLTKKPTVKVPAKPATELTCQDLVVGDGTEVKAGDTVTVQYVGNAQSTGKEFDASWGGDPVSFPLASVIKGWTDGIPGMKVGGRRVLTIPGDQAYGPEGRPPDIGPNDTLVFIIDLKETKASS